MKIAFIYAGQGAQVLGMGKDLCETYPIFREKLEEVDPESKYRDMMFGEDFEELSNTANTQPCMVAFAVAMTALLKEKQVVPSMVAGLSLGEYSALTASGVFTPKQGVDLVAYRGKVMAEGVANISSGMSAIFGLTPEKLQEVCDKSSHLGIVEIANYNCPGQLVLGGETAALEEAGKLAKEAGAKRVIPLQVSGPFHTSLMKGAGDLLAERFQQEKFEEMQIPLVWNTTAKTLGEDENIPDLLVKQVKSSVYFQNSVEFMIEQGVDTFVEIGPGAVLTGFVKKIAKENKCVNITTYSVSDVNSLEKMLEDMASKGA